MTAGPATLPCPAGCSDHGVCDPVSGRCRCPLTRTGPTCSQLVLQACAIEGQPLRPTFILHRGWERRLAIERWVGPLTCACIEQMVQLRNLVQYGNPWVAKSRNPIVCARTPAGEDVGALLAAPQKATWHTLVMALREGASTQSTALKLPPVAGLSWFKLLPEGGGGGGGGGGMPAFTTSEIHRLVPLEQCPQRCGSRGYCVRANANAPARCACFPPAIRGNGDAWDWRDGVVQCGK